MLTIPHEVSMQGRDLDDGVRFRAYLDASEDIEQGGKRSRYAVRSR